jgi:hypothetical protein
MHDTFGFYTIYIGGGLILTNLSFYGSHLFFWFLYHIEHPAVEAYKCNDKPWPWKKDPETWPATLRKTLLSIMFCKHFLADSLVFLDYAFGIIPLRHSIEEFPSLFELCW